MNAAMFLIYILIFLFYYIFLFFMKYESKRADSQSRDDKPEHFVLCWSNTVSYIIWAFTALAGLGRWVVKQPALKENSPDYNYREKSAKTLG